MRFVEVTNQLNVLDGWPTRSESGRGYVLLPGLASAIYGSKEDTRMWFSETNPPKLGEGSRIFAGSVSKQGWRHFISDGEEEEGGICVLFPFSGEYRSVQFRTGEPYTVRFGDVDGLGSNVFAGNVGTFTGDGHWVKFHRYRDEAVFCVLLIDGEIRVLSEDLASLTISERYDDGRIYSTAMI